MRIKVTGYMDTADMEPEFVDESHEMGLSEEGFIYYVANLGMDDLRFEAEPDAAAPVQAPPGKRKP